MSVTAKGLLTLGLLLAVTSEVSPVHAETYLSGDAGFAYSTGGYHWTSPGLLARPPHNVTLDATIAGYGAVVGGSAGVSHRWLSVGFEGEGSYLSTTSNGLGWSAISDVLSLRLGGRIEARCKYPLFARAAFGTQWTTFGSSTDDAGADDNVWNPETNRGVYGSLGLGVRMTHLGVLARFDAAKLTSAHASYAPKTFVLAADATWF
ncbi:MAG: hypothetical protein ACXVEF_29885 [Polyangiales bacterium]